MRLALLALSTLAGALCWPVTGSAYCRTTTIELTAADIDAGVCPEGDPAYWDDLTIHYGFNPSTPFGQLSEADVREVYAEAFATWGAVECEDGSPGFEFVQDQEPYSEADPHHVLGEQNVNVMLFRTAAEWQADPLLAPTGAFAITTVWLDLRKDPGHMLGADMELNGAMGPWVRCPDTGCRSRFVTDLANVVTHEVGHVLGLGESYEELGTMFWSGGQGEINKRDLIADDEAGLCAGHSPGAQLAREEARREPEGGCRCAVASDGPTAGLWGFGLLGLAFVRRRVRPRTP
jgi:MYXO-CTERM domain-containing protein